MLHIQRMASEKKRNYEKSCTRMKNRLSNHFFSFRHPRSTAPSDVHKARYSNDDLGMKIGTTGRRGAKMYFYIIIFQTLPLFAVRDGKRRSRATTNKAFLRDMDWTRQ